MYRTINANNYKQQVESQIKIRKNRRNIQNLNNSSMHAEQGHLKSLASTHASIEQSIQYDTQPMGKNINPVMVPSVYVKDLNTAL